MSFEIRGLEEFIRGLEEIDSELSKEAHKWLEALGFTFLDEVQREIIRSRTVDTRRLLNSFDKGGEDGVFKFTENGLTLEVGTNVEYAKFVNDGHFTDDISKGRDARWVPGHWVGERFEYQPGAETGMLLKFQWVEGSQYFDTAYKIFERMFQVSLDRRLEEFIERKLGGV